MKNKNKTIHFKLLRNSSGISLVEIMVTILIFVILVGGIYISMLAGQSSWEANTVQLELQQDLRNAMEWMKYELQQAGEATITNVPPDGNPRTTITFSLPENIVNGSVNWSADPVQFVLGGTGTNQLLRVSGSDTKVLAENIKTLQFTRNAGAEHILEVAVLGEKNTTLGHTINYLLNFQVQIRNN